ncbi:hypothetical protein [Streptomyces sp. NPDC050287]|uniref:hypothetical protein n=1 Tax=Streptomyces sp. NPDC050287 TaxID=3365608 RepID=UPI00379F73C1
MSEGAPLVVRNRLQYSEPDDLGIVKRLPADRGADIAGVDLFVLDGRGHPKLTPHDAYPAVRQSFREPRAVKDTLAVLSTFTADLLLDALGFWRDAPSLPSHLGSAPYGQVFQQLLEPSGIWADEDCAAHLLLIRWEDWLRAEPQDGGHAAAVPLVRLEHLLHDFLDAVAAFRGRGRTPLLIGVCPASSTFQEAAWAGVFARFDGALRRFCAGLPATSVLVLKEAASFSAEDVHDPFSDRLAHVPYTDEFFTAMAATLARALSTLMAGVPCWSSGGQGRSENVPQLLRDGTPSGLCRTDPGECEPGPYTDTAAQTWRSGRRFSSEAAPAAWEGP